MLQQTEEVGEGFRSRDFVVGSCASYDGGGRTPSAMVHPSDLFERRTHRQSNSSHGGVEVVSRASLVSGISSYV